MIHTAPFKILTDPYSIFSHVALHLKDPEQFYSMLSLQIAYYLFHSFLLYSTFVGIFLQTL